MLIKQSMCDGVDSSITLLSKVYRVLMIPKQECMVYRFPHYVLNYKLLHLMLLFAMLLLSWLKLTIYNDSKSAVNCFIGFDLYVLTYFTDQLPAC